MLPPPLNFILIPLILISPSKSLTRRFSHCYKLLIFWLENILLVLGYFLYFLFLSPYIYLKKIFLIITKLKGFFLILGYLICWILLGPFYLIYTNLEDLMVMVKILSLKQSESIDVN